MKIIKKEIVTNAKTWTDDVICDICKESCKFHYANSFDENNNKIPEYSLEYATLNASWGYGPPWDGDIWESHICVECIKKHIMPLMRINFTDNLPPFYDGYYENGEIYFNDVE